MKNIILFDEESRHADLLPLSFTRPIADFRVGILTIRQKWEKMLNARYSYLTVKYLQEKFPFNLEDDNVFVSGAVIPDVAFVEAVNNLRPGELLVKDGEMIALRGTISDYKTRQGLVREYGAEIRSLHYVFDVFLNNSDAIKEDFLIITRDRKSQPLPDSCAVIGNMYDNEGRGNIFIEEGAKVECVTINVSAGPVYIGEDSEIMEGSMLRGPVAVGMHSKVNMGTRIYPGTTIGPWCKVGGELNNAVMFGYSNKAHDGFIGNAVIGEWCNIGAGTNASNLKNDYSLIRIWNYRKRTFMKTQLQFCGLIMGDHSKAGINCMFNTATVIGVGVNIYGAGFPRAFIPSFSEGSPTGGFSDVSLKKFFDIAARAMLRRDVILDDMDMHIFEYIHDVASELK